MHSRWGKLGCIPITSWILQFPPLPLPPPPFLVRILPSPRARKNDGTGGSIVSAAEAGGSEGGLRTLRNFAVSVVTGTWLLRENAGMAGAASAVGPQSGGAEGMETSGLADMSPSLRCDGTRGGGAWESEDPMGRREPVVYSSGILLGFSEGVKLSRDATTPSLLCITEVIEQFQRCTGMGVIEESSDRCCEKLVGFDWSRIQFPSKHMCNVSNCIVLDPEATSLRAFLSRP
jgi:hypothetical protein